MQKRSEVFAQSC